MYFFFLPMGGVLISGVVAYLQARNTKKKRQSYKGELAPTLIFINVNQKSLRRRSLLPISRRASQTLNISLM
jgi:hypothetical protein